MLLGKPSQPDAEASCSGVSLFLPFQPSTRHVTEGACNDFSPGSPLSTATQKPEQELHRCKQVNAESRKSVSLSHQIWDCFFVM